MTLGNEFEFVRDPGLDPEIKKALLEGLFEEKRSSRDAELKLAEVEKSRLLEQKRLWHNTPLMLALVGTVSVFANGLVAYIQGARTTSDTVTLKQLEAQLRDSEQRSGAERERQVSQLKQQFTLEIAEAEAKRAASKEEREFAFRIVERQLSQDKSEAERAQILLFLIRAGVLSGLKEAELKMMAEASLRKEGPAIPSLVRADSLRQVTAEDLGEFQKFLDSAGVKNIKAEHLLARTDPGTSLSPERRNFYPPRHLWANIVKTAQILDKLYEMVGSPIEIISAYRPVGGAPTSTHATFNAVDFRFPGKGTPGEWAKTLQQLRDRGEFQGGIGIERGGFVHLDTRGHNATWNTLQRQTSESDQEER